MRSVDTIIIHCSASPDGEALFERNALGQVTRTPIQAIDAWHRARGFKRQDGARVRFNPDLTSVGYHFVIYVSGVVVTGRDLGEVGAHVQGHNARSIGICMLGTAAFTPKQWDSLRQLVEKLQARYRSARILGHRDFSPDRNGNGVIEPHEWTKTCPGFDVRQWQAAGFVPPPAAIYQGTLS